MTATRLNPYLSFRDQARAALEFYHSVFGGELALNTFGEFHASEDPAEQDRIMHGELTTPTGLVLMGADTPDSMAFNPGDGPTVSLSGTDEDELRVLWERLSADATVAVQLGPAPWGAVFGMCTDQFGINWLVNITEP